MEEALGVGSMITRDFRPVRFDLMAGQPVAIRLLKAIIAHPESSPRTLILEGSFGSGKTTSARIFAKALNCEKPRQSEPCGQCSNCLEDLMFSTFYREYDSAFVGNVESVRSLRDTFFYVSDAGWRVIVFDEIQLASSQAQGALLKDLEEVPDRVFFVFCTTDPERLLPTIRSRSLEVSFTPVPHAEVVQNLQRIAIEAGFSISEETCRRIAFRSGGYMRNAHMALDRCMLMGESDFLLSMKSAGECFLKYFEAVATGDKEGLSKSVSEMLTFPLSDLKADYQQTVWQLVEALVMGSGSGRAAEVVKALQPEALRVLRQSFSDWLLSSFESDIQLQAALYCLFQACQSSLTQKAASPVTSDRRFRR